MDTLPDAIESYLAYRVGAGRAEATLDADRAALHALVRLLRSVEVTAWTAVTSDHIVWFLDDLATAGRARTTVFGVLWRLRSFFAWLSRRGRILLDPMRALADLVITMPQALPPPPLSEDQVTALFAAIPQRDVFDLRTRLHLELCYGCGLRLGETLALDVRDLDFGERSVLVRCGKGGYTRRVPMNGGTCAAAQNYLELRRGLVTGVDTGALLLGGFGRRIRAQALYGVLAELSAQLGVRVFPHLLRHSIAVHLLRRGVDIRAIQEFLGHAELDTTKVYLRMIPGHLREEYDRAMPVIAVEV